MKLQAFWQCLITLACLLTASSLDHEKSFLVQDGASIVVAIALYKDSLLLTASNDIVQKDIQTGAIQRTFRAHQNLVYSFAVTNDSRMISSGYDDMIMVWDLVSGSVLKRIWLRASNTLITSLQVKNDLVIAGGLDGKTRQIDLASGKIDRTIELNEFLYSVLFNGEYFYVGKQNPPYVVRYSIKRGTLSLRYDAHTDIVFSIYLSGDFLVSGSGDTTVICWNARTADVIQVLSGHMDIVRVVGIFDGFVYSGSQDRAIIKWNMESGQILTRFPLLHLSGVVYFAYKESQLFTGSLDTSVIKWDAVSGDFMFSYEGRNRKLKAVAIWKEFAISSGQEIEIKVWDTSIDSIKPFKVLVDEATSVNSLYVYESFLFSGGSDSLVKQWDLAQFSLKKIYEGSTNLIVSVTADHDFVYSSGYGADIFQWNISSGALTGRLVGHAGWVESVINDGSSLYSGSRDWTIRMWNVQSQQSTMVFYTVHPVSALLRVEDLIIAGAQGSIQSFSIASGETLSYTDEPDGCSSIVSNSENAYTGHSDGSIRVRYLSTLTVIEIFRGHSNLVTSLCFDESYKLYSTGFDGTVKKWNMVTRKVAYSFESRLDSVTSLVVNGDHLFVGTQGGNIFSYNVINAKASETLSYFNKSVTSLLINNSTVYATSLDGLLVKFSANPHDKVSIVYNSNTEALKSLVFNNKYLISLLGETKVLIISNDAIMKTFDFETSLVCIAASDQFLLGGSRSGVIYSWILDSSELSFELKGHVGQVNFLLPVGENLFSASDDKSIIEWSLKEGVSINTLKRLSASSLGHQGPVNSLSFCFNSLFSAGSDFSVHRWNIITGRHDDVYFGFSDAVMTVLCSNGSLFAGGKDSAVLLFKPFLDEVSNRTTSSVTAISTKKRKVARIVQQSRLSQYSDTSNVSLTFGLVIPAVLLVVVASAFLYARIRRNKKAVQISIKTESDSTTTIVDLETVVNSVIGVSKHAAYLIPSSSIAAVRKLTSGGGGELFIAKPMDPSLQKRFGDTVIQKVVFTKTKSHEESFYQEVGIMIMLSSFPHFCQIIGYTENPLSMILKFYPNRSLYEWLRQNKTTTRFSLKLLKELAEALNTMHSHYLAHCDIKPHNILMEINNGVPSCFLTDFGITQILSENILASMMFRISNLRGLSVNYASPEAFTNFRSKRYINVDFKMYDIYSCGCIIYDFVTKKSPWD